MLRASPSKIRSSSEANQYLASTGNVASRTSLYVIEGGGNSARAALAAIAGGAQSGPTVAATAAAYADNIGAIVNGLRRRGDAHCCLGHTQRWYRASDF